MSASIANTSPSANSSAGSSTPIKSTTPKTKSGRPSKWSASRQRKLARLYLYTNLPREDIPRVLKVENGNNKENWVPGKESTIKTVNAILDKEPRWLRPKDREDMDKKILGLSECKTQRRFRRQFSSPPPDELPISDAIPSFDFSETPLEDLLAFAPAEPVRSLVTATNAGGAFDYSLPFSAQEIVYDEELVLPSSMLAEVSDTANGESYPTHNSGEIPSTDDLSLSSTYLSITSLKRRLSRYSSSYVKAIARIVKAHSISDSSAASTIQVSFPILVNTENASVTGSSTIRSSSTLLANVKARIPQLVLPDSILVLERHFKKQGLCIPGIKNHDSNACWCLEELDFNCQTWASHDGLVCVQREDPPRHLGNLNVYFRDVFGNNILHMLAARGANIDVIVDALRQGIDGNAKNTAEQSFLHVFSRHALTRLATNSLALDCFLVKLNAFNVRFFDCDLFGRSFFHLLTRRARKLDRHCLGVLTDLNIQLPSKRDAFGWVATCDPKGFNATLEEQLRKSNPPRNSEESTGSAIYRADHLSTILPGTTGMESPDSTIRFPIADQNNSNDADTFVYSHKALLETATKALDSPTIEDLEGRNGLQCLAEASLDVDEMRALISNSSKRKRGQTKPSSSSRGLTFRYELASTMISFGVDINHYDKNGNSVLMSFVTHLPDGEDDKTLANLFRHLIQSGANLELRNRSGETALHVAVRLGRKVATRVLLECGANMHARTSMGKGVLVLGEMFYFRAREDPRLYASIMACMALCIQYGAVATPSLVMEWEDRNSGFI
ncbi:ankyrin [Mollisia scopiformis]|uniref:Ankyrin n=1 Tax=Mollisia scopiformis TaxID=149040 RepID=A0A194X023_MOLSC|nr:ankyrin [Mollisia scopiformis]KUJ13222.1 ankyrin [Mollisia scopiformis]